MMYEESSAVMLPNIPQGSLTLAGPHGRVNTPSGGAECGGVGTRGQEGFAILGTPVFDDIATTAEGFASLCKMNAHIVSAQGTGLKTLRRAGVAVPTVMQPSTEEVDWESGPPASGPGGCVACVRSGNSLGRVRATNCKDLRQ